MLKAVIFDMDGLLVDTEPFWQEAEMKVFKKVGIELTRQMTASTVGLKINEVVDHWFNLYPWSNGIPKQQVENDVLTELERLIDEKGVKMEGADYIVDFFKSTGLKIALASSSPKQFINFILKKFQLTGTFEIIHSGEYELFGKPDPAIYLTTAELLKIAPDKCLAFEDSYFGLLSAKRAGMKVISVPDKSVWNDEHFNIADIKLHSLLEFSEEHLKMLNAEA